MTTRGQAPDTGLAAYQVVLAMPLPVERMSWLLVELHRASGDPPPAQALAEGLAALGPVLSWRALLAIRGLDHRHQAHLQAVFGSPQLYQHLAVLLAAMADTAALPPWKAPAHGSEAPAIPQWPCLPAILPSHPLGEAARFPPRVAQALGLEAGSLLGTPIPLAGFEFSTQIVHFREAIQRPTPGEAIVIGGGYVGAEVAAGWASEGATVTLIERGPRLMPQYVDAEIEAVRSLLEHSGVCLRMETEALGWEACGNKVIVECREDGGSHHLSADLVLVAVGVRRTDPLQ